MKTFLILLLSCSLLYGQAKVVIYNSTNSPVPVNIISGSTGGTGGDVNVTNTVAVTGAFTSSTNVSATLTDASIGSLTNVSATISGSVAVTRANSDGNITNTVSTLIVGGTNTIQVLQPLTVISMASRYNFEIARSTLASGITNGQCLAPEIVWPDVALSNTNAVTLINFVFFSGDATTTNDFRLHICRAPVTWGATNANWNAVASEVGTNLLATIESSDTTMGKWYDVGKTNRAWRSYPLALAVKPATNSIFLYFEAAATVTNFNGAWGTFTYWP